MTSAFFKSAALATHPAREGCLVAMWRRLAALSMGLPLIVLVLASGCTKPVAVTHEVTTPSVPLTETEWRCSRIGSRILPVEGAPTLMITSNGSASGFAGVNRWSGPCTVDGSAMKFGMLMMTRMAGSPERMALEQAYVGALAAAKHWSVTDGKLQCSDGAAVIMEFLPAR
jgi:heat shock protein HslJ